MHEMHEIIIMMNDFLQPKIKILTKRVTFYRFQYINLQFQVGHYQYFHYLDAYLCDKKFCNEDGTSARLNQMPNQNVSTKLCIQFEIQVCCRFWMCF